MKIKATVTDRVISCAVDGTPVQGVGVDKLLVKLDSEWDGYEHYACWYEVYGEHYKCNLFSHEAGGEDTVPMPAMKPGQLRLTFDAWNGDGKGKHLLTEHMRDGVKLERHGAHTFGSVEKKAGDLLAALVDVKEEAESAIAETRTATTASIDQTNAAKAAEEQRETEFSAKMGEWNREVVDAISDTQQATENAEEAAAAASDAAQAAIYAADSARVSAGTANVQAAAAQSAANAANASKASADQAAAQAQAKATLADQNAAKADQAAQGANAAKASADAAAKAANDAAAKVKADYATDKAVWSMHIADAAKQATDAAEDAESAAQEARDAADAIPELMEEYAKQTELAQVSKVVTDHERRIVNLEAYAQGVLVRQETDADEKYQKAVPAGAAPYASVDSISGKTVKWNQLNRPHITYNISGVTVTDNHDSSMTVTGTPSERTWPEFTYASTERLGYVKKDHVYFATAKLVGAGNINRLYVKYGMGANDANLTVANNTVNDVWRAPSDGNGRSYFYFVAEQDTAYNFTVTPLFIDLTTMFGAGNEPTDLSDPRIAWVKSYAAEHPEYNPGQLVSAEVSKVESVGKNLANPDGLIKGGYGSGKAVIQTWAGQKVTLPHTPSQVSMGACFVTDVKKGETLTASYKGSSQTATVAWTTYRSHDDIHSTANAVSYVDAGSRRTEATLTADADCVAVFIWTNVYSAGVINTFNVEDCQLERGTVATAYSKYGVRDTVEVPAVNLRSAGSVADRADFMAHKTIRKMIEIDLSDYGWQYQQTWQSWYTEYMNFFKTPKKGGEKANIVSEKYETVSSNKVVGDGHTDVLGIGTTITPNVNDQRLVVRNGSSTEKPSGKAVIELREQTEEPLDIDPAIEVEPGGTITFVQEDVPMDIPNSVTYDINVKEALNV